MSRRIFVVASAIASAILAFVTALVISASIAFAAPVVNFGNFGFTFNEFQAVATTDTSFGSDLTVIVGKTTSVDLFAAEDGTPIQVFINGTCYTCYLPSF